MSARPVRIPAPFTWALFVVLWALLAPPQLGGRLSWVIVDGKSMLPTFRYGDMVMAWQSHSYAVGDVLAFRHPDIGIVIHRAVGKQGGRFIMKGDNNHWTDNYQPAQEDIVGKAFLRLPGVGKAIVWMRAKRWPLYGVGLGALWLAFSDLGRKRPFRRGGKWAQGDGGKTSAARRTTAADLLLLPAGLTAAFLILLLYLAGRPDTRPVQDDYNYRQVGQFAYIGEAPDGIYDENTIKSGDPVFPDLTRSVVVGFHYDFSSPVEADLSGTYSLEAELISPHGWRRAIPLVPETPFTGRSFDAVSSLDLYAVRETIRTAEKVTQFKQTAYAIAIQADVRLQGELGGRPLAETFTPQMLYQFDPMLMQVAIAQDEDFSPLVQEKDGTIEGTRQVTNTASIFWFALPVASLRLAVGILLGLSALYLVAAVAYVWREWRRGEDVRIRLSHGSLLLDAVDVPESGRVVEVASADELARLAERLGVAVLRQPREDGYVYRVLDGEITYRYNTGGQMAQLREEAA